MLELSEDPAPRMIGTFPGTFFRYHPVCASMLFEVEDQRAGNTAHFPGASDGIRYYADEE